MESNIQQAKKYLGVAHKIDALITDLLANSGLSVKADFEILSKLERLKEQALDTSIRFEDAVTENK
jgi:hypothetical protein